MCLGTIDEKTKNWRVGYKVFFFDYLNCSMHPIFFNLNLSFEKNKWIVDKEDDILQSSTGKKYKTGFHFFRNKKEATNCYKLDYGHKIFKIKVRDIVATGTQGVYKTGVAREIFIIDE